MFISRPPPAAGAAVWVVLPAARRVRERKNEQNMIKLGSNIVVVHTAKAREELIGLSASAFAGGNGEDWP